MGKLLMPKATAVWLVENTTLTFEQIAKLCSLHHLEVKGIADGDVASGVIGLNPILSGQLTAEEIKRCEENENAEVQLVVREDLPEVRTRAKGPRYTPMTKRTEKPDAISWLLKTYPAMSDAAIGRLLATTKDTIATIRDRTHWNIANIKPQNPVLMGLCSLKDLEAEVAKIRPSRIAALQSQAGAAAESNQTEDESSNNSANPFAAALAAYASAAQKKVQSEPTIESVFGTQPKGSTADDSDEA